MEVWKHRLKVVEEQTIMLPKGAKFISLMMQDMAPTIWSLVDPFEALVEPHVVHCIGTGQSFDGTGMTHLGSVVDGRYVWHFFEKV